jgi:hypothetical protein
LDGVIYRLTARHVEVSARLAELEAKISAARERADGETVTQEQQHELLELSELSHRDVSFTDDELVHLKWLTNLSDLDLNHTSISDAGLAHIEGLIKLERLNLSRTHITDAGLAHLTALTNLSSLDLGGTQITDAGLVHLKRLTKLRALSLRFETHVTEVGVKELQQALPSLKISR